MQRDWTASTSLLLLRACSPSPGADCSADEGSRPDLIDPALLRPGRLDKSLLCDMPSHSDRLEVSLLPHTLATDRLQIMLACSRKIALAPSVDLSLYATRTAGFSGADLQAFIYNAHLDAIHAGLSASMEGDVTTSGGAEEGREIVHVAFGGGTEGKVLSRAEQAGVTKRVSRSIAQERS